jgi:Xaa-Pro dipeptidase
MTDSNFAQLYPAHVALLKDRWSKALAMHGFDSVAIYAGAQHVAFQDDELYPFKTNPHFKQWVPLLEHPHSFIVWTAGGEKPILVYHQPVDYWYMPPSAPQGYWLNQFDVRIVTEPGHAREHLPKSGRTAFVGEWGAEFGEWGFHDPNAQALLDHVHFERAWKSEYEIESMRVANRIGARAHKAAEAAFRSGASEFEIHLEYLRATQHVEEQLPYHNIIAFGSHAAVLHYQRLERSRPGHEGARSFLIDAGATFNGYASDITRTYAANDGEFQQFIDAVDGFQQELCAAVRPGLDYKELHLLAHRKVAQVLADFDFVNVDADAAYEQGITRTFLPHGVGHYIGLQVHDVAGFAADACGATIARPEGHPYLRLTRIIEKDQTFTVEPGIYFIESLLADLKKGETSKLVNWNRVEEFRPFGGVRIEDDVRVREGAVENMTRDAFAAG